MSSEKEDPLEEFIEIYGEYVSLRELGLASLFSTAGAFLLYFATPYIADLFNLQAIKQTLAISLGVIGATIGFLVSIGFTRVKRLIVEEK